MTTAAVTNSTTRIDGALRAVVDAVTLRAQDLDDHATDVRHDIGVLGAAGLFAPGLDGDLRQMVRIIDDVSASSLAVGFSAWAHRMATQYVHLGSDDVRATHLEPLRTGTRPGVTAMAAGLKHVAGLGPLPITAERDGADLILTGPIHWASNVFDDAVIVLPAATADGGVVVAVDAHAPGVTRHRARDLMALNATGSTSLHLEAVRVPPGAVVSDDLVGFVARIRATFLLLQTAFCLGVSRAAVDGATAVTGGLADQLAPDLAECGHRLADASGALYRHAAEPARAATLDLVRLRLDAARLAADATRTEVAVTGGRAYAVGNAANRRFREAAFLSIQSPSEGQLRWELTQSR